MKKHAVAPMAHGVLCALLTAACAGSTPTAPAGEAPGVTPSPLTVPAPAAARYRVTFQATWSAASHAIDFPTRAHFSPLVGGTHNGGVRFWEQGGAASIGIKDMAERGRTSPLDGEVAAAVAAGTANQILVGGDIASSPGVVTLEFEMNQAFPLVTLVSMIAPSPDWFVGVAGLPLFEAGQWVAERRVDLVPWDAGTDSGTTFTAADVVTEPPQPVTPITTPPLSPGGSVRPLGTFTFTRL